MDQLMVKQDSFLSFSLIVQVEMNLVTRIQRGRNTMQQMDFGTGTPGIKSPLLCLGLYDPKQGYFTSLSLISSKHHCVKHSWIITIEK